LRVTVQTLITKGEGLSAINVPTIQPFLGWIFSSNFVCALFHLIAVSPSAGESTRGYLHGSLFVDFVGQLGPTSKFRLLLIDVAITVLQLLLLSVVAARKAVEKKRLKVRNGQLVWEDPNHVQTLDAEERGVVENHAVDTESNVHSNHEAQREHSHNPQESQLLRQRDELYASRSNIGTFWLLDIAKLQRHKDRTIFSGPSYTLSAAISRDIRQRRQRYSLNIPFRS
jgi:hypothetical protein